MIAELADLLLQAIDMRYLATGLLVLVAACLQGVSGLGFAMVSAPLAALFAPELVPGPLLALSFPLALLAALREARHIDWRSAGIALGGRAVGSLLALGLLLSVPAPSMALALGLLLLLAVGFSATGWRCPPTAPNLAAAGLASGLMGTVTSAGAPPFAIVMSNWAPARLRATLGCVFSAGTAISLVTLGLAGQFQRAHLVLSARLLPWAMLGFALSHLFASRLPQAGLRPLLLGLAGAGSLAVLWRALA